MAGNNNNKTTTTTAKIKAMNSSRFIITMATFILHNLISQVFGRHELVLEYPKLNKLRFWMIF